MLQEKHVLVFFDVKLGCFQRLIALKKMFSARETLCDQLYSTNTTFLFVRRKIVLDRVIAPGEVFFEFSASHPAFRLILLKTSFLLVFG